MHGGVGLCDAPLKDGVLICTMHGFKLLPFKSEPLVVVRRDGGEVGV